MTSSTEVASEPGAGGGGPAEPEVSLGGYQAADPLDPALTAVPRGRPLGWWGMVWLIVTEAMLFSGLLSAWFFVRAGSDTWPPEGIVEPELPLPSLFTVVLLASSLPVVYAESAIRRNEIMRVRVALAASWLMGAAFLAYQLVEYDGLTFGISDNAYGSLWYGITGLHGLHVLVGLVMSAVVQLKAGTGRLGPDHHLTLQVFALYWHFVDVVWIAVFSSLFLGSHVA